MGMYTEIILDVKLSKDIDENLKDWLLLQTINIDEYGDDEYWAKLVQLCPPKLRVTRVECINKCDNKNRMFEIFGHYSLHLEFEIKNYESELELLVETLKPFIINTGKIGTLLYEEYDTPGDIILENNILTFNYGTEQSY